MTKWATLVAALGALLPLSACGYLGTAYQQPTVVTSFYPLQYVAQQIVGDHERVLDLTHPGMEPHDIELTVGQTADVVDADVVLYERGFQAAVDTAVAQTQPRHVVDASAVADLHGQDPHFWQDPTRLSKVAAAFTDQMAEADPRHAADYRANLARLQKRLARLDRDYRTVLARCRQRTVVVSHEAFAYLGRRYHLEIVPINGLSPDAEPSPAHLRQLHDLIRSRGVTTVFTERLASPALAQTLADDLGLRVAVLDPIEGLSDATAHQDYLSLMRQNLAALRKANDCG
ncbi:MAG: metal ABC transporter substrate-binding protein [Nocardioidaceae bacterium]